MFKKKEKEFEEYKLKKNKFHKILMYIFWGMLIYIFLRGVRSSLLPDSKEEVNSIIQDFKVELRQYKETDYEIMSYAQNFVKEYLTYEKNQKIDHKNRLLKYVTNNFFTNDLVDYSGNAEVTYVQAYRKEEYGKNQFNVYVLADVLYSMQRLSEDNTTVQTDSQKESLVLKVPIYALEGNYVVEDIPVFVSDHNHLENYYVDMLRENELTDSTMKKEIEGSISNFFKAYYEQEQEVVNYYLSKRALKDKFLGLQGRFLFQKVEAISVFNRGEELICLVRIKISDSVNQASFTQQFNLSLEKENDKYYVIDMDTKITNLKY